jgi:hypothetical protein
VFHRFWQEIHFTMLRCLTMEPEAPTTREIWGRLTDLHAMTVAAPMLAPFRIGIEHAQAALAGA